MFPMTLIPTQIPHLNDGPERLGELPNNPPKPEPPPHNITPNIINHIAQELSISLSNMPYICNMVDVDHTASTHSTAEDESSTSYLRPTLQTCHHQTPTHFQNQNNITSYQCPLHTLYN
jgi:hypothetical protein